MPQGKPGGVRCVQLSANNLCLLFGKSERPAVCQRLRPSVEMCGESADHALAWLTELERATQPIWAYQLALNPLAWQRPWYILDARI